MSLVHTLPSLPGLVHSLIVICAHMQIRIAFSMHYIKACFLCTVHCAQCTVLLCSCWQRAPRMADDPQPREWPWSEHKGNGKRQKDWTHCSGEGVLWGGAGGGGSKSTRSCREACSAAAAAMQDTSLDELVEMHDCSSKKQDRVRREGKHFPVGWA